ncbi:MAG: excinuclease ABC subunit UvrC [Alphaproteobacteria bacterium]|jgi:excinuclease ABC subunit C|nr:excinuclease ABC subunit UvrC [Alphaproteobacteria bacterium]
MAALDLGRAAVHEALENMSAAPGVYRMLDAKGEALYVGKAKSLKRRLASYANPGRISTRILKMISLTRAVEVITTHTEVEALLLESNLIKRLRPRYNILLRDDKSFPFILITGDHDWPQITKHRGARSRKGEYFGPFASAGAVNRTLNTLQKAFPLRSCSDSIFEGRTRPCLQYQIKRCLAPCVGRIGAAEYDGLVAETRRFLSGRSQEVQKELSERMAAASEALEFERAAALRDRLRALAHIQSHQGVNVASVQEADVVAVHQEGGQSCIQVFFYRAGQNWGNRAYFPSHGREAGEAEVLAAFLGQFYDDKPPPREVLLNRDIEGQALLAEALGVKAGRRVRVHRPLRGDKRELAAQAEANARDALARRLAENASQRRLLEEVAELFGLDAAPGRIEVYDNSHIQGTNAIGAMVVAGPEGFQRNAYRKFNIKSQTLAPGDDYAMLREVLNRRFSRLVKAEAEAADADDAAPEAQAASENRRIAGERPDLVMIDGGPGHLTAALEVFAELGIDDIPLTAIAKGPDRNAGREHLYLPGRPALVPNQRGATLYFLQRLRDEAHRFAIGTHRARRAKDLGRSTLDEIPGVGPRRKRALLNHFGSARGVEQAALADLESIAGVSKAVARRIYDYFHPEA